MCFVSVCVAFCFHYMEALASALIFVRLQSFIHPLLHVHVGCASTHTNVGRRERRRRRRAENVNATACTAFRLTNTPASSSSSSHSGWMMMRRCHVLPQCTWKGISRCAYAPRSLRSILHAPAYPFNENVMWVQCTGQAAWCGLGRLHALRTPCAWENNMIFRARLCNFFEITIWIDKIKLLLLFLWTAHNVCLLGSESFVLSFRMVPGHFKNWQKSNLQHNY